jgi:hypothetical protein
MKHAIRFVLLACLILGFLTGSAFSAEIKGQVRIYNGNPSNGIGMNGVTVLLHDLTAGTTQSTVTATDAAFLLLHPTLTSPLGVYHFYDIIGSHLYSVEVVPPIGTALATNPSQGPWWNANPRSCATSYYNCFLMLLTGNYFDPKTMGYWKHQATVAVTGQGAYQVSPAQLQQYLNLVFQNFNSDQYFPIQGVTSVDGQPLTAQDMLITYNLPNGGSAGMINKAKKQLLTTLLNIASQYCYAWRVISNDDRNVSQAIQFGADMITNNGAAAGTAMSSLDKINNGEMVPSGWIPGSYVIVYDAGSELMPTVTPTAILPESPLVLNNYPNPFNPQTTISYTLPANGLARLAVYDVNGRQVADLINTWQQAGTHEVRFDGTTLTSGLYLCRLSAGNNTTTLKLMLVK